VHNGEAIAVLPPIRFISGKITVDFNETCNTVRILKWLGEVCIGPITALFNMTLKSKLAGLQKTY
jgi:hypothetical protein